MRIVTEDVPPPALQGRDIGIVIGGNRFEFGHGGDQLLGDVVGVAFEFEQDLEQIHQRTGARTADSTSRRQIRGRRLSGRSRPASTASIRPRPILPSTKPLGMPRTRDRALGRCRAGGRRSGTARRRAGCGCAAGRGSSPHGRAKRRRPAARPDNGAGPVWA